MQTSALYVLLVGSVLILALLSEVGLERLGFPDLLGYLAIGIGLRALDHTWPVVPAPSAHVLRFLSEFGIIVLLFRVGLQCNPKNLFHRLPGATLIAVTNTVVSGGLGFVVAYDVLHLGLIPSLFVAVALTTTSIGVSTRVWAQYRGLDSREGAMMLDVAEIDDLIGVVLLALLTALFPYLQQGVGPELVRPMLWTFAIVMLKMTGLMLVGLVFARYLEHPMMRLLRAAQIRSNGMLIVLGIAMIVSGLTAFLGFPVALGGFFAGLLFSRDQHSVTVGEAFDSLYRLFVPFFFVGIGFALDLWQLGPALGPACILFIAAVLGKGLSSFVSAYATMPGESAALLAVSLVPRSEITLVVMERGLDLGALSRTTFTSVVLVVVATMIGAPLLLLVLSDDQTTEPAPSAS